MAKCSSGPRGYGAAEAPSPRRLLSFALPDGSSERYVYGYRLYRSADTRDFVMDVKPAEDRTRRPWRFSVGEELLAAVDVVRGAGERAVAHDVHGESGDIGRADHPSDGKPRAQFLAPGIDLIPQQ